MTDLFIIQNPGRLKSDLSALISLYLSDSLNFPKLQNIVIKNVRPSCSRRESWINVSEAMVSLINL